MKIKPVFFWKVKADMRKFLINPGCLFILCLWLTGAMAQNPLREAKYRVSVFLLEDCKISQAYIPELIRLNQTFANDSIVFEGLFPAPSSDPEGLGNFIRRYALPWSCKLDPDQSEAGRLGIHVMPEVAVWRTDNGNLLYRGRIDNRWADIGKRRAKATRHELEDCLTAITRGAVWEFKETKAVGCILSSED